MRTSIVVWSTLSGTILGLFIDAALIGVGVLLTTALPANVAARMQSRWLVIAFAVALAAVPVVLSVLGYLEGELKSA